MPLLSFGHIRVVIKRFNESQVSNSQFIADFGDAADYRVN